MPKVIEFVWRRQLAAAARRRIMRASASEGGTEAVLVGFADLVGFTARPSSSRKPSWPRS